MPIAGRLPAAARPSRHPFATGRRAWAKGLNRRLGLDRLPIIRKVIYSVLGATVLLLGFVMIALPGPAIIVIPLGFAILASEFAWARHILRRGKVFVGRRTQRRKPRRKT